MKIKKQKNESCRMEDMRGNNYWYLNGKLHKEDGPSIEHNDGNKFWYFKGSFIFNFLDKQINFANKFNGGSINKTHKDFIFKNIYLFNKKTL